MWDFQSQFHALAERAAKSLFTSLDPTFSPRVLLVGLLQSHRADSHPMTIEPQDGNCNLSDLSNLLEVHESLGRLVVSRLYTEERSQLKAQHDQLRATLLKDLEFADKNNQYKYFCAQPGSIEDYLVFPVLQVDLKAYESQGRLQKGERLNGEQVEVSLPDAAISEFLIECQRLVSVSEPLIDSGVFRSPSETLRAAGQRLMLTPERLKGATKGDLFQTCATIASLKYEGEEGIGKMIIADVGHPSVEVKISFLETVELRSYRAVRKLLQLASSELSLISDSERIIGLGLVRDNYDSSREDLFTIRFVKHHVWELIHADTVLMRTTYGEPRLSRARFQEKKFRADLKRMFFGITTESIHRLSEIAREASRQKHGTLMLITEDAAGEAERLKRHCARISPTTFGTDTIRTITSIDGAVIFDTNGVCYAIGAILDGTASRFGTSARGARFNSAIRYVDSRKNPCFAVVVSEDGTVDFVPDIMPEEELLMLEGELERLRKIFNGTGLDTKVFYEVMDWFDAHRRYLGEAVCSELNWLQDRFQRILPAGGFRIVYPEFTPDGLMHELE